MLIILLVIGLLVLMFGVVGWLVSITFNLHIEEYFMVLNVIVIILISAILTIGSIETII